MRLISLLLVTGLLSAAASAQLGEPTITELEWSDRHDLNEKIRTVDDLGRRNFGIPVRNDKTDLQLLQRIADEKIIDPEDTEKLQALGAVLGKVLERELEVQWRIYDDQRGRSRALCIPDTQHCLFPLTMLSRRLELGLDVNVEKVYDNAVAALDPYLPDDNPYDGRKAPPAPEWQPPTGPIKKIRVE